MREQAADLFRVMSREQLEETAIRAMIRIRQDKEEKRRSSFFVAVLGGFMLGTLVAASGFITGSVLP